MSTPPVLLVPAPLVEPDLAQGLAAPAPTTASAPAPLLPLGSAVLEHGHDLSQAAGAGPIYDEFEQSQALVSGMGKPSLDAEEPDEIDMSQPVAKAPPKALFSLLGGAAASSNGLPPQIFELIAMHGASVRFGRRLATAGSSSDDSLIIFLTERSDLGISRTNGHVEFDEARGVILHRLVREGFPTFHQGKLMVAESIQLAHNDTIGFGSSDPAVPSEETVTYRADLSKLGPLALPDSLRMPPPPPLFSRAHAGEAAAAAAAEDPPEVEGGGDEGAEAGAKRGRGERGGRSQRKKPRDGGEEESTPLVSAEDAARRERARQLAGLSGETKRYAQRLLEQFGASRSRLLDLIDDVREEGMAQPHALDSLERVARGSAGRLRDIADDLERTLRRIRLDSERDGARHAQHDARQGHHGPAAVHSSSNSGGGGGGRGAGKSSWGSGKGGSKGGGGKGGGGKGSGGKGSGKRAKLADVAGGV